MSIGPLTGRFGVAPKEIVVLQENLEDPSKSLVIVREYGPFDVEKKGAPISEKYIDMRYAPRRS